MIVLLNSTALRRCACALAVALLAAATLELSGCGRRGPLEPPPVPGASPKPTSSDDDLGGPVKAPKAAPLTPPTQSLPIDKLL